MLVAEAPLRQLGSRVARTWAEGGSGVSSPRGAGRAARVRFFRGGGWPPRPFPPTGTTLPKGDITILVADRHPLSREALGVALRAVGGFEVVGLAGTGAEVLARCGSLRPDVTLLDLDLDEVGAAGTISELLARCPGVSIVALTLYPDDGRAEGAMARGARAHLSKGAPLEDLSRTIREVHHGERPVPPRLTEEVRGPGP